VTPQVEDMPHSNCEVEDIAAYVDGELGGAALTRFEQHVKECAACAHELRLQRQLLCTLDVAFNDQTAFDLPNNFARVVTARAENDLSGMRNRSERRRALQLCAVLALVAFSLLGAATRTVVLDPLRSFFRTTRVLFDLVWQSISQVGSSALVLIRVIGRGLLLSQTGSRFFLVLAFLLSISFLSLLIVKYHRAQIIE
jgi:putative zinc finger protein